MSSSVARNNSPSTTFISAVRCVLTSEFDQVYTRYSPGGASRVDHRDACVRAMGALRRDVLRHLDAIYNEQRLRLARDTQVNQLPEDVLIHIFSLFPTLELVTISTVCYYWRVLALETPSLWANIELEGDCTDALREILLRSQLAPISIHLSRHHDRARGQSCDLIAAISPHLDRVRCLSIGPLRNQLNLRPDSPASLLSIGEMPPVPVKLVLPKHHQLRVLHMDWNEQVDGRLTIASLTSADFVDVSLQHLVLQGVNFPAALWMPCTALRSLALDWPRDWKISHISSVVSKNPMLRKLALYMLPGRWDRRTWVEDGPAIPHNLETLLLSAQHIEHSSFSMLLRRLSSLSLLQIVLDIEIIDVPNFLGLVQTALPHLQVIHFLDLRHCRRSLWNVPVFRLVDERGFRLIFASQHMRHLLALPCFDALRALRVNVEEWVEALNSRHDIQLLALEELYLVGNVLDFGNRQRSVLCPRLVTVVIEVFDTTSHVSLPYYSTYYGSSHWTLAAAIVAVRLHGYRRPLRELVVVDSALTATEVYDTRHTGLFDRLLLLNRGRFPSARLSSKPFEFIGDPMIASTF